jgi:glycosyltransferase involved in cell wall biosynthesis
MDRQESPAYPHATEQLGITQPCRLTPLLSVLIATRNRYIYAYALIKDILSWADERIEVVVSDNSEETILARWVSELTPDPRLKYQYNPGRISAIDNFNKVVDAASGSFVCLIGDDDGLHPAAIDAVAWADRASVDCLIGSLVHEYIWPSLIDPTIEDPRTAAGHNGILSLPKFTGRMQIHRGPLDLQPLLNRGCTQYHDLGYPRLYHGFVRRSVIEEMRHLAGSVLDGLSPDIYAAVLLSQLAGFTVSLDYPLTIPGVCPASGTATEGKAKGYSTDIRDAPHFRSREWYVFNSKIPPFYCVDAIWADSACLALKNMKLDHRCSDLKIFRLAAYIMRHQPSLREVLLLWLVEQGHAKTRGSALRLTALAYMGPPFVSDLRRAASKFLRVLGLEGARRLQDLPTITEARHAITAHVSRLPLPWSGVTEFTT